MHFLSKLFFPKISELCVVVQCSFDFSEPRGFDSTRDNLLHNSILFNCSLFSSKFLRILLELRLSSTYWKSRNLESLWGCRDVPYHAPSRVKYLAAVWNWRIFFSRIFQNGSFRMPIGWIVAILCYIRWSAVCGEVLHQLQHQNARGVSSEGSDDSFLACFFAEFWRQSCFLIVFVVHNRCLSFSDWWCPSAKGWVFFGDHRLDSSKILNSVYCAERSRLTHFFPSRQNFGTCNLKYEFV